VLSRVNLSVGELDLKLNEDAANDVVLQGEELARLSVKPFAPEMVALCRVDQLGRDPKDLAGFLHAALEDITHAEVIGDGLHLDRPALVSGDRGSRDHEQLRRFRERCDQILRQAVGKVFLLRIAGQVCEGYDRDRRSVREGKRQAGLRSKSCHPFRFARVENP
jgi:hypothetical protein